MNNLNALFADATVNEQDFRESLFETLGLSPDETPEERRGELPAEIHFARDDSIRVSFREGVARVAIRLNGFRSDGREYRNGPWLASTTYAPRLRPVGVERNPHRRDRTGARRGRSGGNTPASPAAIPHRKGLFGGSHPNGRNDPRTEAAVLPVASGEGMGQRGLGSCSGDSSSRGKKRSGGSIFRDRELRSMTGAILRLSWGAARWALLCFLLAGVVDAQTLQPVRPPSPAQMEQWKLLLGFQGKGSTICYDAGVVAEAYHWIPAIRENQVVLTASSGGSVLAVYFSCHGISRETIEYVAKRAREADYSVVRGNENVQAKTLKLLVNESTEMPIEVLKEYIGIALGLHDKPRDIADVARRSHAARGCRW